MLCVLLSGCSSVQPQRGGVATIGKAILKPFTSLGASTPTPARISTPRPLETAGDGSLASVTQPDNPGQQSAQNFDYEETEELVFSAASTITESEGNLTRTTSIPAGSKKVIKKTQKVGQTIGAAQKDTARNTAAQLASFKGVQWIGCLALLAGAFGFFNPALRALIGGKDTAMAVAGAGLVMVFGPSIFVSYEKYFLLAILGAAAYWFWSRAKYKESRLDALEEK